jgi:uncharacterized protein DUF5672
MPPNSRPFDDRSFCSMRAFVRSILRLLLPEYRPLPPPAKRVAVLIPVSARTEMTADEEVSMRHLLHHLGHYDKYLIAPPGADFRWEGFEVVRFSGRFFGSAFANDQLYYRPEFYRRFANYEYIMIYHLDALVFSDDLLQWCETGIDYIGPPWIHCSDAPWVKEPKVGNGGFTLIKIESALKVLHNRYRVQPGKYWKEKLAPAWKALQPIVEPLRRLASKYLGARVSRFIDQRVENLNKMGVDKLANDLFWGFEAEKYLPELRVADWRTGLRFAFEVGPKVCFELNQHKLPFGCHAWARYDRGFWEPYLLKEGAERRSASRPVVEST